MLQILNDWFKLCLIPLILTLTVASLEDGKWIKKKTTNKLEFEQDNTQLWIFFSIIEVVNSSETQKSIQNESNSNETTSTNEYLSTNLTSQYTNITINNNNTNEPLLKKLLIPLNMSYLLNTTDANSTIYFDYKNSTSYLNDTLIETDSNQINDNTTSILVNSSSESNTTIFITNSTKIVKKLGFNPSSISTPVITTSAISNEINLANTTESSLFTFNDGMVPSTTSNPRILDDTPSSSSSG